MSGKTSWQVFPLAGYPDDLWRDWQQLTDAHHQSNPMLGSVFVKLLIEYFGGELFVARVGARDALQAMVLLQKADNGIWQSFMPSQVQIALLVIDPECALDVDGLCRALPGFCPRIDFFGLDPDEHPGVLKELQNVQKYADNMRIERETDFATYWQGRSKKLKSNLNRYKKKLVADGLQEDYRVIGCHEQVADAVDRYGILESAGWKGRQGTSLHPSNVQGAFYRKLLSTMAEERNALVFEIYLQDVLVASRLCIRNAHEVFSLKTTFDENHKQYALGRLNLYQLIEYCFDRTDIGNIEFYTNANKDQMSWATHERPMFNASVYSGSLAATFLKGALSARTTLRALLSRENQRVRRS